MAGRRLHLSASAKRVKHGAQTAGGGETAHHRGGLGAAAAA